jgi:glycyl-tRNA synthetase alpha chain
MEVTQFTYFQQTGSVDLNPVPVELTYGLERLAMFIQGVDSIFDIRWSRDRTWGDILKDPEFEWCHLNYRETDTAFHFELFRFYEAEAQRLLDKGLVFPGYDYTIKCSHVFNLLEARGAISVTERTGYIGRIRKLARRAALAYVEKREKLGFPLLGGEAAR